MNDDDKRALDKCTQELDEIKVCISKNQAHPLVRYLTDYCVIRACSTLEHVMKDIFYEFMSKKAGRETKNYLEKHILDSSSNPSIHWIEALLDELKPAWKSLFESKIADRDKGGLNSLVTSRNKVAHGDCYMDRSINDIINYFESGKNVLSTLEGIIGTKSKNG